MVKHAVGQTALNHHLHGNVLKEPRFPDKFHNLVFVELPVVLKYTYNVPIPVPYM
jgi:hypothetical protein